MCQSRGDFEEHGRNADARQAVEGVLHVDGEAVTLGRQQRERHGPHPVEDQAGQGGRARARQYPDEPRTVSGPFGSWHEPLPSKKLNSFNSGCTLQEDREVQPGLLNFHVGVTASHIRAVHAA